MAKPKPKRKPSPPAKSGLVRKPKPAPRSKSAPKSKRPKPKTATRTPTRKPSPRTPDAIQVLRAIDALDQALRLTRERGDQLLACADQIREVGASHRSASLITSLVSAGILRDLAAFAACPPEQWPASLAGIRLFPTALLSWMKDQLGIEQQLEIGQEFEAMAARLDRFDVVGDPLPEVPIHRLRVISPGWNCEGRVVAKPSVEIVQ